MIVANPRQIALTGRSHRKTDRTDAEQLARLGRADPQLLAPIRHRSAQSQQHLAVVRSRNILVHSRTRLINHIRGAVRAWGASLPRCTAPTFHRKVAEHIPTELLPALTTLLEVTGDITARIAEADREIEALCAAYPETTSLRPVTGVGPLTALSFVLTVEDHTRFPRAREVGATWGWCPGSASRGSGSRSWGSPRAAMST